MYIIIYVQDVTNRLLFLGQVHPGTSGVAAARMNSWNQDFHQVSF